MTRTLPPRRRRWSLKETGLGDVGKHRPTKCKRSTKRTVRRKVEKR